jgi:membrane fusion protein
MSGFDPRIFRAAAIENYGVQDDVGEVVKVSPPWTWALFTVVSAGILAALGASFVARVEVTGRGIGVVRPVGGVRILTTQVGGEVAEIAVTSGESVEEGRTVVRLASAPLRSELVDVDRQLEMLESDHGAFSARQDASASEQVRLLRSRLMMLEEQVQSQAESVRLFERKLEAHLELGKQGLVSAMAVDDGREALAQSQRQLSATRQTLAQTRQELASLSGLRQEDLWRRQRELESARSRRRALNITLGQLLVLAPTSGFVEAVLVKPGDVVQAGQTVGKLIPGEKRFQVVSFLSEKDRPFVQPNDVVRLEIEPLPLAELGTLRGTVVRIGADLASTAELRDALGDGARLETPTYRVEIRIDEDSLRRSHRVLRSGMQMTVRYALRRPRLAALMLEPLRRWLE